MHLIGAKQVSAAAFVSNRLFTGKRLQNFHDYRVTLKMEITKRLLSIDHNAGFLYAILVS